VIESGPRLLDTVDAVLFDLDGTLLDTAKDLIHALNLVCDEQGQKRPDSEIAACYVSHGAVGLVKHAFPNSVADEVEPLRARLVKIYEQNLCVHTVPYHGVSEMLAYLDQRKIPWGVVTNKMRYLAEPIMEQIGMLENCCSLVGGDTAARNKPHPDPVLHALDAMGVRADNAIYMGDAEKDILAGKAANATTIAASWGYIVPGQSPHDWDADYTIDHPSDLLTLTRSTQR
jgi:2-phosphoglycolate phosphatase